MSLNWRLVLSFWKVNWIINQTLISKKRSYLENRYFLIGFFTVISTRGREKNQVVYLAM